MLVRDIPAYKPFILCSGGDDPRKLLVKDNEGSVSEVSGYRHLGSFHESHGLFIELYDLKVSPDASAHLVEGINIHYQ